jgi:hypothetical protein
MSSQDRVALLRVVEAWEALPGGRNYSALEIEDWLRDHMKPAIDNARRTMNLQIPTKS